MRRGEGGVKAIRRARGERSGREKVKRVSSEEEKEKDEEEEEEEKNRRRGRDKILRRGQEKVRRDEVGSVYKLHTCKMLHPPMALRH